LRSLHDSNDRVRQSLEKLQTTLVSARLPDGRRRTVQMLGGTDMDDDERIEGVLTYDFHRKLVPVLRRSEIYARMDTKILSAFTSKYSLALYEVITARVNLHKSTEEISIDTLRQWFGVERGKLTDWPSDREAVRFGHLASSPQPFEAPACCSGVMDGVLGVAVAEIVLDQAQIVALVGQVVAAGVAERVRVDARQASALSC